MTFLWVHGIIFWVIAMYNQEIKERFISEVLDRPRATLAGSIFKELEKSESELGLDIAEMDEGQVWISMKNVNLMELSRLYTFNTIMNAYVKWCRENKIFQEVKDGALSVDSSFDISDQIRSALFKDEAEFLSEMRRVCKVEDGFVEPVILALAWVGVTREEVFELLDSDVDLDSRKIYNRDGDLVVQMYSDAISDLLQTYVHTNVGTRDHRTGYRTVIKDRSVPNFVKRFCSRTAKELGTPMDRRSCRTILYRVSKLYEALGNPARLTFENVWKSGRYHALYQMELSGIDVTSPDNEDLVLALFRSKKYYRGIMWFYPSYKKAFNLQGLV